MRENLKEKLKDKIFEKLLDLLMLGSEYEKLEKEQDSKLVG